MKYRYQYILSFKLNEPFDVNYVNSICNKYPNSNILVEVQNTKGISSDMIRQLNSNAAIRIAGGYDKKRVELNKNRKFSDGETGQYYFDAVIYSKNETIKILEEIERIESGISNNWSDIQKFLYVYDRLKTGIMYDPKFEQKFSSEIRSLRGLLSKQTVCCGYAMILKEFMDRNNIECEYVEGYTKYDQNGRKVGGHAWNIICINGKKYPIDLTWDNTRFRSGQSKSFDWMCKSVQDFSKCHMPEPYEKTQDYNRTLSQIDQQIINRLYSQIGLGRAKNFSSTTYIGKRKDGSRFIVAQIGDTKYNNKNYYRYYYTELSSDDKMENPLILYSQTNVANLVDCKKFNRKIPPNYEETVDNILFSKENINDSLFRGTYYIGCVKKNTNSNKLELVSSYQEINKDEEDNKLFVYPTRTYTRSDKSTFIAQQTASKKVNGIEMFSFDIFEMVKENGREVLKKNTVYTERNFFFDNRQGLVDDYLSRERLDRKVGEAGGYIGYYDENGFRTYDPDFVKIFETSKRIDFESIDKENKQTTNMVVTIPSFSELKSLVSRYEIVIDYDNMENFDTSKIKVKDINTGQVLTDPNVLYKAMFANIWLSAAGTKCYYDENRPGERTAFNEQSEKLYNTICSELLKSCKEKRVIDTVKLFKEIESINDNRYNKEIIVGLFRSPYQTNMINGMFTRSLGFVDKNQKPECLYNMSYAGNLAFNDNTSRGR